MHPTLNLPLERRRNKRPVASPLNNGCHCPAVLVRRDSASEKVVYSSLSYAYFICRAMMPVMAVTDFSGTMRQVSVMATRSCSI